MRGSGKLANKNYYIEAWNDGHSPVVLITLLHRLYPTELILK
jgi:hypothetical protein